MESRFGLYVAVTIDSEVVLPTPVQIAFFRVAHAAITNVARHSGASEAMVVFDAVKGQAMLSVQDDGVGFDKASVPPGHHGLEIMKERLDKIGGILEVETAPGNGCRITVIWFADDQFDDYSDNAG